MEGSDLKRGKEVEVDSCEGLRVSGSIVESGGGDVVESGAGA